MKPAGFRSAGWFSADRWWAKRRVNYTWRVVLAIAAAAIILTLLAVGAMPARADDSWINWGGYISPIDGSHCCGARDCFVVPASEVKATPDGYLLQGGELVPYTEAQGSEDESYWRCKRPDGSRRCFFAPQPGS